MISIFSNAVNTITAVLSALCILFLLPMLFGMKAYIVMSGSMEPVLQTGSVAYVDTHFSGDDAAIGDIIAFRSMDSLVTHRVIDKTADGEFITKGDANSSPDPVPVAREHVIGRTVFSVPAAGYILAELKGRKLYCFVFLLILLNCSGALKIYLQPQRSFRLPYSSRTDITLSKNFQIKRRKQQ